MKPHEEEKKHLKGWKEMNSAHLIGNIVRDPELKTTQNGKENVSFTLACQRTKDQTDFVPCVAWESIARTIGQYCKKGDKLGVSGRISTRKYEDKNGQKHYITEIVVEKIDLLGVKQNESDDSFPF